MMGQGDRVNATGSPSPLAPAWDQTSDPAAYKPIKANELVSSL
jgi:hypothetical protein